MMRLTAAIVTTLTSLLVCVGYAAPPATQPASMPATAATASQPATSSQPTTDPAALRILQGLEDAGRQYKTLRADVEFQVVLGDVGDTEERTGWVAYQAAQVGPGGKSTPARFRITFETARLGAGRAFRETIDYAFDGQWLTIAKHKIKQMTRYQVAAEGEAAEPMRLGKGPFPVPFGQKVAEVLEYFEVSIRPAAPDEPAETDYLQLKTRPNRAKDIEFRTIELGIERKTRLPVRVVSRDKKDNVTTVLFKQLRTDPPLSDDVFRLPERLGWQVKVERLESLSQ